ncbi:MAG: hypothetical protein ACRCSN_21880 [Dermatophilaceae bacterium]
MDEMEFTVDEGSMASADHFFSAGAHLIALLDQVSDVPVDWLLTDLHLGSAVARIAAPMATPEASSVLRRVVSGLRDIGAGHAAPRDWNPDAVSTARHFVEASTRSGEDMGNARAHLRLATSGPDSTPVPLTRELADILAALQPFERRMPGAVRGRLVGLNVSRGNRASLRQDGGRIARVAFDDSLRQPFKEAMLEKVELVGEVRQDADGVVFHVRASGVRTLATGRTDWTSLFGIEPNLTGGRTVEDYLQDARGEA